MQTPQTLRELFDIAVDLPPSARASWLAANCPDASLREQVERLLIADGATDPSIARTAGEALSRGRRFEPFRLLAMLGGWLRRRG